MVRKAAKLSKGAKQWGQTGSIPKGVQGTGSIRTARKGRTKSDTPKGSVVNRGGPGRQSYVMYDRQEGGYWSGSKPGKKKYAFCGAENRTGDTECLKPKGHPGNHRYSGIL